MATVNEIKASELRYRPLFEAAHHSDEFWNKALDRLKTLVEG